MEIYDLEFDVTEDELLEFVKEYMLIRYLKEKYKKNNINRKELGQEIIEKVDLLNMIITRLKHELRIDKDIYRFSNYISDSNLVLELLLHLANKKNSKYTLKEFNTEKIHSDKIDKELSTTQNDIFVISNKDALDQIKEDNLVSLKQFQSEITKLVFKGNSVAILANYSFDWHILPRNDNIRNTYIKRFKVNKFVSDLCCYANKDELGDAINQLDKYIEKFGGDISGLSIDNLVERINSLKDNKQKIKKF